MRKMLEKQGGYTLLELLVVVVCVFILAALFLLYRSQ